MKKCLLFSLGLCLCYASSSQGIEGLQDKLRVQVNNEGLVGAAWSILDNGIISRGAIGLKDASDSTSLRVEDKIHIGSVTKTIIATGVLRLVSEGKIALDATVESLIPQISFNNPWKNTHKVTVKDLLNHTSGLEDARLWQVFSTEASPKTPLLEVFDRDKEVLKIHSKPGTRFSYSNIGYTMLGLLIERVTGEPYEKYLDENLLEPLGMRNSTFQFVSQRDDPSLAMGHFDDGTIQPSVPMFLRPAGQFTTTAYDMALLAQFLIGDGKIGDDLFIRQDLLKAMGRPKTTEAFQNGLNTGYQFGLSYRDRYGVIGYYHSGNIIGYRAALYLFPDQQKAFFISFNADNETADYQSFNEIFIDYLQISRPEATPVGPSGFDLNLLEGYYKLNPVRFSLFSYLDILFNSINVTSKGQSELQISSFQNGNYSIYPVGKNLFRRSDRIRASHAIYERSGKYVITDGLVTYEAMCVPYFWSIWLSLILGFLGMTIIILRGCYKLTLGGGFTKNQGLVFPFFSILLLLIPIPFFFNQSFMQLGDLTIGNILLTIVTGILPLALVIGVIQVLRANNKAKMRKLDLVAIVFFLQWIIVLIFWGLIPLTLWA